MDGLTYWRAILLGALQGVTEFLPVSSSGHLVLAQALLGLELPGLTLEIMLHAGTALAIVVAFRRDLAELWRAVLARRSGDEGRRLVGLLMLASVPAAVVGLLASDFIEETLTSPRLAACMLLVTAAILVFGQPAVAGRLRAANAGPLRALLIGIAQAFAILPGISRSGSTVITGLRAGVDRREAARFSLLLALPVMLGGALIDLASLLRNAGSSAVAVPPGPLVAGVVTAFVFGLAAIRGLLIAVQSARLWWFGLYCAVAGLMALLLL